MTQKDKALLLTDLCARLPYKTLISIDGDGNRYRLEEICHAIIGIDTYKTTVENCNIEQVKPYLFPLSSMTKEQESYLHFNTKFRTTRFGDLVVKVDEDDNYFYTDTSDYLSLIDWLNKNHFDYRNLIDKNLAIDCTNLNIY